MSLVATMLLLIALVLAGLSWHLSRQIAERKTQLIGLQNALVDTLAKKRTADIKQAALLEQQEIVEKTVKTGAETAETVHKAVADVAFGVMDAIPVTEDVSKIARGLHDGIASSIYSTVRTSNTQFGGLAREFLKLKGEYDKSRPAAKATTEPDPSSADADATEQQKSNPTPSAPQKKDADRDTSE